MPPFPPSWQGGGDPTVCILGRHNVASYTPLLRLVLPRFGTQWVFVVCRWRWWRGDAVLATGFEAGFTSFVSSPVTHHVLPFHLWAQVCRLAPGGACSFRFSWGLGSFCLHHVLTGSFYFSKVSYSNKSALVAFLFPVWGQASLCRTLDS